MDVMNGKADGWASIQERLEKLRDSFRAPSSSRPRRLHACDCAIRACVRQLAQPGGLPAQGAQVLALVQEAFQAYLSLEPHLPPLYLEKILFHALRNAAGWAGSCTWRVAELLRARLRCCGPGQDRDNIAQSSFNVLWNSAAALAGPDRPREEGRAVLRARLCALRFLLLLERDEGPLVLPQPPFFTSCTAKYAATAATFYEAERAPCPLFVARQLQELLLDTLQVEALHPLGLQDSLCFLELTLQRCRLLCKGRRHREALEALQDARAFLVSVETLGPPLELLEAGVRLSRVLLKGCGTLGPLLCRAGVALGGECSGRILRVLAEGAQFVAAQLKELQRRRELPLGLQDLPGLCSFCEGHGWVLRRLLGEIPPDSVTQQLMVKQLLFHSFQLFSCATYNTFQGSQPSGWPGLPEVTRSCVQIVTWMVEALQGLPEAEWAKCLDIIATTTHKLGHAFYSWNFLEAARAVCEPLCQGVLASGGYGCPGVAPEQLHKCFRLQVESWQRQRQPERALDAVARWVLALGSTPGHAEPLLGHPGPLLAEPLGLWARIKTEAAKQGVEELQLWTLRDALEAHSCSRSLDEDTVVSLLLAELQAYKCLHRPTGPERYNVLCDLLGVGELPRGLPHSLPQAAALLELAQLLCYHSFAPHTNCSALDAIHEALRLLESMPWNSQIQDQLLDERAQALLWLHICTIEAHLEESLERERRGKAQGRREPEELEPHELGSEGRAGERPDPWGGIRCSLATERALSKPLDEAFSLWKQLLEKPGIPCVRCPEQTVVSLRLLASLYHLQAQPIQALESFLLLQSLCQKLGDTLGMANALCQVTRILLQLECPSQAQVFLEELESCLEETAGGDDSNSFLLLQRSRLLLRSYLCCLQQKVEEGVSLLLAALQDSAAQKPTKGWYLAQAQGLQLVAMFLELPHSRLDARLREQIHRQGWKSPKVALLEAQKLLRSVIVFLMGSDILGTSQSLQPEEPVLDSSANVVLKWQLLGDVLCCCQRLVTLLGRAELPCRARAFCREALAVAGHLQAPRWCALFLVLNSQLELQQGEQELSQALLQHAQDLLQPCAELQPSQEPPCRARIQLRKGLLQRAKPQHPLPREEGEEFLKGPALQSLAPAPLPARPDALTASPELQPGRERSLKFLCHPEGCSCRLCSDPILASLCLRWLLAQAQGQLLAGEVAPGVALLRRLLPRCARTSTRLARELRDRVWGTAGNEATSRDGEPLRNSETISDRELPRDRDLSGTRDPSRNGALQDLPGNGDPSRHRELPFPQLQAPPGDSDLPSLALLDELVATGYSTLALQSMTTMEPWDEELEQGLTFLGSRSPSVPGLGVAMATLLLAKAVATLGRVALALGCSLDDVLAQAWTLWLPPLPEHKKTPKNPKAAPKVTKAEPQKLKPAKSRKPPRAKPPKVVDICATGDSDTDVPLIILQPGGLCTPGPKKEGPRKVLLAPGTKTPFTIFNEASPAPGGNSQLSRAPRIARKAKPCMRVTFSDDSDTEDPKSPLSTPRTTRTISCARRVQHPKSPRNSLGTGARPHQRQRRKDLEKRGTPQMGALEKRAKGNPQTALEKKEKGIPQRALKKKEKRGTHWAGGPQEKKEQGTPQSEVLEEKWKQEFPRTEEWDPLRAMKEEELQLSFELPQGASGGASEDVPKKEDKVDARNPEGSDTSTRPGEPSLDAVLALLREALAWVAHFPPGSLYGQLCRLLALALGDRDPLATAGLLAESLSVTARHQLLAIVHARGRKSRKLAAAEDLSEELQRFSLQDGDPSQASSHLAELEELFQFSSTGLGAAERDRFREQLRQIPSGVTVCQLSLASAWPGAVGDTLLLTRLERDREPLSMCIPTERSQAPLSSVLQELESIQREQRENNACTERRLWWERRFSLDLRMKNLIQTLESQVLGCWRGLLLPRPLGNPPLDEEESAQLLQGLQKCGWESPDPVLLQVLLSSLTLPDVPAVAFSLCPTRPLRAQLLLEEALERRPEQPPGQGGSLVLLLDQHVQRLPWESTGLLRDVPATRLPGLRFLLSYSRTRQKRSGLVLNQGVNPRNTFYVLNPQRDLEGTEQRFRAWFESEPGWQGVSGMAPSPQQMREALTQRDLYIYAGHGAGARLLDGHSLSRLEFRPAALLFGCSSAALAPRGRLEPSGTVLNYILAGCPLVLGNLWDVTDRDLDRLAQALLEGWLRGRPRTPLLPHLAQARQAPKLQFLVGAAPVVYGLPVSLC